MRRVGDLIAGQNPRPHGPLSLAGAALILAAGLIHLFLTPEHFEESRYLGWLFLADFAGSAVAAFGVYRGPGGVGRSEPWSPAARSCCTS